MTKALLITINIDEGPFNYHIYIYCHIYFPWTPPFLKRNTVCKRLNPPNAKLFRVCFRGVSHRCAFVKLSAKEGGIAPSWGSANFPNKVSPDIIWGITAIVSQHRAIIVAHVCRDLLSRYTRFAADFLRILGLSRCGSGIALHPPKKALSHLSSFNCQGCRTSSCL